ncbi:MAG: hypothetical protein K2Q26_13995 [Bdellovibrionales bacterium]|nr:hypothetical protein [Bdellovibrionales bacterium]
MLIICILLRCRSIGAQALKHIILSLLSVCSAQIAHADQCTNIFRVKETLPLEQLIERFLEIESKVELLYRDLYTQLARSSAEKGNLESAMQSLDAVRNKLSVLQDRILSEDPLARIEIDQIGRDIKTLRQELLENPNSLKATPATHLQLTDFAKNPEKIEPNTNYRLVVGEFIYQVKFSEYIVTEVFRNPLHSVQAKKSISAILNGFNSSASSHLKLVVPQTWILQTSILSKDVGTFRIYGVKKGQVIFFEKFIDKSNHSDKWMQSNLMPLMKNIYFERFGENP